MQVNNNGRAKEVQNTLQSRELSNQGAPKGGAKISSLLNSMWCLKQLLHCTNSTKISLTHRLGYVWDAHHQGSSASTVSPEKEEANGYDVALDPLGEGAARSSTQQCGGPALLHSAATAQHGASSSYHRMPATPRTLAICTTLQVCKPQ